MMQVPLPQQRSSSCMFGSRLVVDSVVRMAAETKQVWVVRQLDTTNILTASGFRSLVGGR